jgi:cell wall-associated NlpC family hydrolase
MKKSIITLIIVSYFTANMVAVNPIQKTLDSIASVRVPDKREGICNFRAGWRKDRVYFTGETTELAAIKDLYKVMKLRKVRFYDGIQLLPDTSTEKRCFGLVRVSVMNIRKSPMHSAELLSQAVMGTPVRILKDSDDYYLLQTPDNYIGWATHASVERKTTAELKTWNNEKRLLFTSKSGVIYTDTLKSAVLSDIVMTSVALELNTENQWTKISLPDNRIGFVESKNLTNFAEWAKNTQPNAAAIIALSNQFNGVSYLWGGTSAHMLDCSGFVKTLYFMNGLLLPRDASQQYKKGINVDTSVNYSQLKQGDLLFFGERLPHKLRVTHVGMFVGNKRFIHESEWIHISSLDDSSPDYSKYYHGRLLLVKRLIGTNTDNLRIYNNRMYF